MVYHIINVTNIIYFQESIIFFSKFSNNISFGYPLGFFMLYAKKDLKLQVITYLGCLDNDNSVIY